MRTGPASGQRWLVPVTEYAGLTPYTGGIGTHYAALLPALVDAGAEVDLVVFSQGPLDADAALGGVRIARHYDLSRLPRPVALPVRAALTRLAYRRGEYDRVFLAEWGGLGAALPREAPVLTNLATSLRLSHEISGFGARDLPVADRVTAAVQNRLEDRQISRSAGLIAISRAMLRWAQKQYDAVLPPARIVRNCIEIDRVVASSREGHLPERWPSEQGPVVLFLGRLERRKGVVEAVQAFARVVETVPDVRLVLAGAGGNSRFEPSRAELLAMLPEWAHSRVVWLGHVSDSSLYRGIAHSAVVVCPSRWEGFGNAALEAKAVGVPLVCTTGSGFDDFCRNERDALMVEPGDAAELATAIVRVLSDRAVADALGRAAAAGADRYAPEPVAADLLRAADELLAQRTLRSSPTRRRRAGWRQPLRTH